MAGNHISKVAEKGWMASLDSPSRVRTGQMPLERRRVAMMIWLASQPTWAQVGILLACGYVAAAVVIGAFTAAAIYLAEREE